jgi:hypothetical protein
MLTAILPAVTFGIVGAVGYSQYRKMKDKAPRDDRNVHPAESLQRKDMDDQGTDPTQRSPHGSGMPNPSDNANFGHA